MQATRRAGQSLARMASLRHASSQHRASAFQWVTVGLAALALIMGTVLIVAGACVAGHAGTDVAHHHDGVAHHDHTSHQRAQPTAWDSLCASSCQAVSTDILTTLVVSICVAVLVERVYRSAHEPLFVRLSVSLPLRAPPVLL